MVARSWLWRGRGSPKSESTVEFWLHSGTRAGGPMRYSVVSGRSPTRISESSCGCLGALGRLAETSWRRFTSWKTKHPGIERHTLWWREPSRAPSCYA